MRDQEPLEPELAELVRAEKACAPEPPERVRAAVLVALATRIGVLPPSGSGGGGTPAGGAPTSGTVAAVSRLIAAHPTASVLSALVVGAALGAAGTRAVTPTPAPRIVYVEAPAPVAPAPPATTAEPPASPSASAPVVALPPRPVLPAAASASPTASIDARGLAAERMILDAARASLGRGEPAEALSAVERHAHTYPQGALREEREALAVKALAASGDYEQARARGERFRRDFPRSVSLGAINATLASLPE